MSATPTLQESPLIEHLLELRRRLILSCAVFAGAFCIAYYFSESIFYLLIRPLAQAFDTIEGRRLIYTGLTEAFMTYLKVGMFAGAFVSFPVILSQIWLFVGPGLYAQEKKALRPFLFAIPVLFIIGALFAYFVVIPTAWKFFLQFETPAGMGGLPIQLEARMHEYLSLIMQLLLVFGLSFQLPVVMLLLAKFGLIKREMLVAKRKYAFLMVMIASAFLTPPDVFSMLALAIPLYLLYEASIQLMRFMGTMEHTPLPDQIENA